MEWKIIDSLASPITGTFFAAVSSPRNLKLILWYQSDFFLRSGHRLSTNNFGIAIDGRLKKINIIHTIPFRPQVWTDLIKKTGCPGNLPVFNGQCLNTKLCKFKQCPYGIKKAPPLR